MKRPLISLTSDFGVQSQGIGCMKGVALDISPDANVIDLMHGLPDFDLSAASRTMETVKFLPVGYHVCVVDPGVGTERRAIIIRTKRGDYLVGPDNGVLISAAKTLGGCEKAVEITNPKYMRHPVSPIFHGRDVFVPAAALLSMGVRIEEFGEELRFSELVKAPYGEASVAKGAIQSRVILVNKFGTLILNIQQPVWSRFGVKKNDRLVLEFAGKRRVEAPFVDTFGDVGIGQPLIMPDDYGRTEAAINMGSFSKTFGVKSGEKCVIRKK
ncbi:MAG: SAM-dependent chlorinase/fluorinase [Candidatus Aenigmarchaeota archaeon]|nr:SAM-dependent chlorinase/fluorinase [Candidatus Aenigmarchaeota archaeon]